MCARLPAQVQQVLEACGRDERRLAPFALEQGVGRDGRPVREPLDALRAGARALRRATDSSWRAGGEHLRGGHAALVQDDRIRERSRPRRRRAQPFRKTDSVAIRGLLFDFDGLLVDTETPARLVWEELYRAHGHELPQDQWATLVGTIGAPFDPFGHLEELVGRRLDEQALTTRRRAREDELTELEELRPGVEDYFADAERLGLRTAVVSSSDDDWIARHLGRLGHLEGLDAIVAANGDTERAKPRPDLYLEALDRLGLRPNEAIAFEDSPNGVTAAKAAGLICVAVPNPITATLALDDADLVLESLADVPLPELPRTRSSGLG